MTTLAELQARGLRASWGPGMRPVLEVPEDMAGDAAAELELDVRNEVANRLERVRVGARALVQRGECDVCAEQLPPGRGGMCFLCAAAAALKLAGRMKAPAIAEAPPVLDEAPPSPVAKGEPIPKTLLVDLSAVFWWRWHASAGKARDEAFETSVGECVRLSELYPRTIICCDAGRSFRYDLYPAYKGNRPPRDRAAIEQLQRVKDALLARGMRLAGVAGYEADDVIATLCRQAYELEADVVIAGSDKDLLQLVNERIHFLDLRSGKILGTHEVCEKLGVLPYQVRDFLALVGDSADNIKGVPKIGATYAARLLKEHFTNERLLEAVKTRPESIEPRVVRESLLAHPEALELSTLLTTLKTDAPVSFLDCEVAPNLDEQPAEAPPQDSRPPAELELERPAPEPLESPIMNDTQSTHGAPATQQPAPALELDLPTPTPTAPAPTAPPTYGQALRSAIGGGIDAAYASGALPGPASPPPTTPAPPPAAAPPIVAQVAALATASAQPAAAPAKPAAAAPPKPKADDRFAVVRGPDRSPHKFILTGRSGIGKTFFVSTIPNVFIIPVEEGLKGVSPDHEPAHFEKTPRTLQEFHDFLERFHTKENAPVNGRRPFNHLALDTLSGIETLVHEHVCDGEKVPHMESKEYKKLWHAAAPVWGKVKRTLDTIRHSGVHLWMLAHSTETIETISTTGDVYRRWDLRLKGSGDIGVEMRGMWRDWADHVFFIDWIVSLRKEKGKRGVPKYETRVMYTHETASHYAKTRSKLPSSLPCTYQDLRNAMAAGFAAPEAKLRQQISAVVADLDEEQSAAIAADLEAAKGPNSLAAILSRAQGMLAIAREEADDEAEEEPEAQPAGDAGDAAAA